MRRLAWLAVLALPACAAAAPDAPVESADGGACKGDSLAQFTGQRATPQLGADMLRVSRARRLQWVAHGMMVTMEFSPDRLRVYLTADNRVERASCG